MTDLALHMPGDWQDLYQAAWRLASGPMLPIRALKLVQPCAAIRGPSIVAVILKCVIRVDNLR